MYKSQSSTLASLFGGIAALGVLAITTQAQTWPTPPPLPASADQPAVVQADAGAATPASTPPTPQRPAHPITPAGVTGIERIAEYVRQLRHISDIDQNPFQKTRSLLRFIARTRVGRFPVAQYISDYAAADAQTVPATLRERFLNLPFDRLLDAVNTSLGDVDNAQIIARLFEQRRDEARGVRDRTGSSLLAGMGLARVMEGVFARNGGAASYDRVNRIAHMLESPRAVAHE